MTDLPYTVLSCAMSIDGYVDSPTVQRLPLSNATDFDRVDEMRASCDAILVGAATVRNDDPRLLVRSPHRRIERTARGFAASPAKVTITRRGELDPAANFFARDGTRKLVYCPSLVFEQTQARLGPVATVIDAGPGTDVDLRVISADLAARRINRLMVEGGATIHTQFLTAELADELHLVLAPLFVGDSRARRFVDDGEFPWSVGQRATLVEVRQIGDIALLRYALSVRSITNSKLES